MKKIAFTLSLLMLSFLIFACASSPSVYDSRLEKFQTATAEEILSQMTTEEKIAQLFVICPEQLEPKSLKKASRKFSSLLQKYPVGGFIFFGRNLENPAQTRAFLSELRDKSLLPPILSIDEEGGRVARLARSENFFLPKFRNMDSVGRTKATENARGAGQIIGSYLATFGFNLDFAPVVDVNTNPDNIVIGDRAFGSEPESVSDMAGAFLSGLHSTGVKGCIKHFPGHGDTKGDTHLDYVAVTKDWEELKKCELIPFVKNISSADCVMVAHVTCSKIDSSFPASLSKILITEKLRGELGYQGLILTDSLRMKAISKNYGSDQACVLAFEAGNDILLMPANFYESYEAMLEAVRSGRISMARLDESLLRILHFKGL